MPFATLRGRSLHYTTYPPTSKSPSGVSIILIHGLGSTQNYYGPILPFLSAHNCITFDNYGAGRSKYLADTHPETSIDSIAKDVLGLLDHLSIDKAIVVGYSMGGMVPTTIAASAEGKGRVVAGVCIGPVHPSPAVAGVFQKRIETVKEGGIETMANTIPTAATNPKLATPLQKSFIREMIMSQDPAGYIANCRAIETASPPNYAAVTCPMLIVAGDIDKSAPVEGCKFIYESLTGVKEGEKEIEVLPGVGHWYAVEAAEIVGEVVASWCDQWAGKVGGGN